MQAKLFRSFAVSFTALAGLLLFPAAGSAQTGSLNGKVIGEDGKPLEGVWIKIERKDIKGSYKVKTKKKGDYFHAGLPLGTYDVGVEIDGKIIDFLTAKNVRVGMSDPQPIDFDLQAARKRATEQQAAIASGTVTKEQARDMTPEQRAAMEKALKEREAAMSKNKALNDAFNAGMQALNAQQFDAAIASLVKAGELDPKQAVVWANLGDAYVKAAKTKTGADKTAAQTAGFEAYAKALELKPEDANTHNNYALALADGGKFPEAQAELTKAAQLDPPQAGKYFYNLGALLTNNQQIDAAGEAFKKAFEADPNYADAHYQYGIYLISKATITPEGKVVPQAGTKEAFQKYIELRPDGVNAESAKAMLASMDAAISTEYRNPAAKKSAPAATKKK